MSSSSTLFEARRDSVTPPLSNSQASITQVCSSNHNGDFHKSRLVEELHSRTETDEWDHILGTALLLANHRIPEHTNNLGGLSRNNFCTDEWEYIQPRVNSSTRPHQHHTDENILCFTESTSYNSVCCFPNSRCPSGASTNVTADGVVERLQ
eukprot:Filipodium_phascolosomae@DN3471_c0_g1_i1.p1